MRILSYHQVPFSNETPIGKHYEELALKKLIDARAVAHHCFEEPGDNTKIWRYLDLPKFLSLIQTKSLHFTRADQLRKLDKFEGALLTRLAKRFHERMKAGEEILPPDYPMQSKTWLELQKHRHLFHEKYEMKSNYVNCWHMSENENFAMWRIYADTYGICIQSTFKNLYESFNGKSWNYFNEDKKIYIGKVIYHDSDQSIVQNGNSFWPFLYKGKEFEYERELRCMIWDTSIFQQDAYQKQVDVETAESITAEVNLHILVEQIYISPIAPEWFLDCIKKLCANYGLGEKLVRKSVMS